MFATNAFSTKTHSGRRFRNNRPRKPDTGSHVSARELLEYLQQAQDHYERDSIFRELIDLHAPIVERIARHYRGQDEPNEDLRHVATVGLIQAIREFTPGRGRTFLSLALPRMTGQIDRYLRHHRGALPVPRAYLENRTALARATAAFEQHHGHSPRVSELAEMLEMTLTDTADLVSAQSALSLNTGEEDDHGETPLGDPPEEERLPRGITDRAALRAVLNGLSPRDRKIVLMRFTEDKPRTQIAEQLGVSKEHVSHVLSSALAGLRERTARDLPSRTARP